MNELQKECGQCVKNFQQARKQITECIRNAMDRGLSQKEIMAVADRYLTGDCEFGPIIDKRIGYVRHNTQ